MAEQKAKIQIVLESIDGDVFFVSSEVPGTKWRDIQKCLNGDKAFVVLPGEDGYERLFTQCVLEAVVPKRLITLVK
jgi:hypothetical protein